MKIKQVEELVGITSKNIRFYESQGLLTPERADNGYREYHQDNIEVLKKIKLLRKIGISVEDIKSVLNDNVTLENCLEKYLDVLEKQKSNLTNMYNLTEEIINQKCELNNLKTDEWLEKMENMEKEGIDFVNISKFDIHMKKKMGAIIGGAVMIVFMIFLIGMFLWGNSVDPIPLGLLIVLVAIPVVIIVCIIGVLIGRIREIEEEKKMKLLSIDYIPGTEIEALGMVKGTVVQTKNVGRDFMAGMKTLVGGEIVGYTEMLNEARQIAVKRMVDEAKELDADAVIGVKYGSSQVMSGAAEVIAYGTAVKIIDN